MRANLHLKKLDSNGRSSELREAFMKEELRFQYLIRNATKFTLIRNGWLRIKLKSLSL